MRVFVGIDLGSTTTKAVVLHEDGEVIGRGITNSRSNYDVAARIVRDEALVRTRFALLERRVAHIEELERNFKLQQHLEQLDRLREAMLMLAGGPKHAAYRDDLRWRVDHICSEMRERAQAQFAPGATRKSDFFRDLAAADYLSLAEGLAEPKGITFDILCGVFDAAILAVENATVENAFERHIRAAMASVILSRGTARPPVILSRVDGEESQIAHLEILRRASPTQDDGLLEAVEEVLAIELEECGTVGTGYGRQRLPFPKEQIRSEILCHGLGAHAMFPSTRTVLDIGGQDTKAIQLDGEGIVTSFQMNDRCAAGCGRYLGYIADEMNLAVHELGPMAMQSRSRVKINSTCTVFAGAELRERLALGQQREDIVAGLHRAIILRALSLLARSGGVRDELTFTGGVARNPAAVGALQELVRENYGERRLNTSPDSIYTGALGAALFARRAA